MGFTTGGADHPLDVEYRPSKGSLSPVGAMSDESAFTVANTCPVSRSLQVYVCQFFGIVNLCNWYIDKGRGKVYADYTVVFLWLGEWRSRPSSFLPCIPLGLCHRPRGILLPPRITTS
jgi:hypothetical protein